MRRSALVILVAVAAFAMPGSAAARPADLDPPCFGAAARDAEHPCVNPVLEYSVTPSPADAPLMPSLPCTPQEQADLVYVCAFGVPAAEAVATVALVGDSHAGQWRPALQVVAEAEHWRVLSITRDGCPYSFAVKRTAEPLLPLCLRWDREVTQWFGVHPEVSMVFAGELASRRGVIPPPGVRWLAASIRGYTDAWAALPPSVGRIVVIRDNPRPSIMTSPCIDRARAAGRPLAGACALRRRRHLFPDAAAMAAVRLGSPRVGVVDLTRFFCGRRRCFPVVGGVLVFKDTSHLTAVFARTLGPYLLRAIDPARAG